MIKIVEYLRLSDTIIIYTTTKVCVGACLPSQVRLNKIIDRSIAIDCIAEMNMVTENIYVSFLKCNPRE